MMVQAAKTAKAAAAAVCHVPNSAPDKAAHCRKDCAGVGVVPAAAWLHCGPLHQLPGLLMVTHPNQLPAPSSPRLPATPSHHTPPNPHIYAHRPSIAV